MQIYPNRFEAELDKGLKPCYLLFGDEPQQKFSMIEAVREKARAQGFTERKVFVADSGFNWSQLIEATQSLSLFASQQIIELELPTGKPGTDGSQTLQSVAANLGNDILLLIHGPRIGKDVQKAKWFKVLDDTGIHSICYALEGNNLHTWIQQTMQKAGLNGDTACVRMIADMCEGNMLAAHQEIQKLSLVYAGQAITPEQVEAAIVDQSRFNVFQLVDVMLNGDRQRCIRMLYRLESEGIEPNILIWALIREWQTLSQLHEVRSSGQPVQWMKFGIWKNRQGCYQSALSRLSAAQLDHIREALEQADFAFKQNTVERPYIKLAHLCMLFMGIELNGLTLMPDLH